ncbi:MULTISPECIES: proline--tRNA ligase [Psychrilyobacter]|uniref:Proline--tRNA ligase n=1 Tax=Psychrilyobacter piezotolerans TaxID=2293438 RepID=A0ABX9KK84_9FUSO|nr:MULTISPECIES: proline--tRNA ligase [Psychrilyobacter]MCS5420880.1 proline--tRNA ligase [Psychrilyobacter sp. S5]NDI76801.1 proline--tRNA ligase [Psychrilyobacter piezotolerans]RDE65085.1 proline--tRNA ligase [Psychrilyobacter sp. S5]REI42655.1 proline--tRNA ligase [Psychrilyobacter piezotolerans]
MRFSKMYAKTLKETPKDAEVISHQLMLRSGMIKKLASGVYTYLPLGYKALKKVEKITREEMDRAGSQELFMPVLQPAELWKETGRWDAMGPEMMRLKDRHDRDFILGPTHEEVITDIIRNDISSYKSLPLSLYQIQTKFRDERRPRFGLMRGREFLMKDAYSFHANDESLDEEFENMKAAYTRVFERCGLKFRSVEADSGAIGGSGSQEFHVLAESGEDEIIYCNTCGYAANLEKAESVVKEEIVETKEELAEVELKDTPNVAKIDDVCEYFGIPASKTVKAITYMDTLSLKVYMVLQRGDYEINEVKLKNLVDETDLVMLSDADLVAHNLIKGYMGPYNVELGDIILVADESVTKMINHTAGGNKVDTHYVNVNYGRDYTAHIVGDVRSVRAGEGCPRCNEGELESARGIEAGHVFKLGKKYSESMGATYLDENGKTNIMTMGCYGIGVSRTMAAAIEQNNDENGIIWPMSIAPYLVDVIPANIKDADQLGLAEKLYAELNDKNIDTVIDDRKERPGFKFKDADLIGFPIKLIVGRGAKDGLVEVKIRKTNEAFEVKAEEVISFIEELIAKG